MCREEKGHEPPGQSVVQVIDQARLRAGAKRGDAIGRIGKGVAHPRSAGAHVVVSSLLEGDVGGGIAHEDHGDQQGDQRDRRPADDQHITGDQVGGEPAADGGSESDAAVAGGLVEAERQAAALGPNQVDLHHHRHRPGEALVDAEEEVGGDDPGPGRCDADQQRDGQGDRPAGDQQTAPAYPLGKRPGPEIGERLGEAERDDEREDRDG